MLTLVQRTVMVTKKTKPMRIASVGSTTAVADVAGLLVVAVKRSVTAFADHRAAAPRTGSYFDH